MTLRHVDLSLVLLGFLVLDPGQRRLDRRRRSASSASLAMVLVTDVPIGTVLATTVWSASASWTLAALPLFIWMGEILFRTRLSEQMFRGLSPWLQWLPGRLIHVNIIGCGIFAAVSGSSAATCATIGKIALPELEEARLRREAQPRLAGGLGHARPADPALDPDGGLRGHRQRLGAAGLPRRLPARPARDGALYRATSSSGRCSIPARRRRAIRRCRSCEKLQAVGQARPLPAADPRGVPRR